MTETNTPATTAAESFVVDPERLRRYADEQRASDPGTKAYYARRGVTSEVEQQMRADVVRVTRLLEEARNVSDLGEFKKFSRQADEIRLQWERHDDFEARMDWEYLADAADDWRRRPGSMEQLYEQVIIERVDGWTESMSDEEWRSQRQAREMAGRGQWNEARDPFSAEAGRSRPTSEADPANPNHYADSCSYHAERLLRADFARVYQLDQERGETVTDSEYFRITEQMHELAEPWVTRNDTRTEWRDMRTLAAGTYSNRSEYADAVEQIEQHRPGPIGLDSMFNRSVEQVRELKGVERPYFSVDASHAPRPVVSSAFAAARTAELRQCGRAPIPGHAFADLAGGREREGIER
ncbi:hypothetical protein [Nocardia testacea]|uniref:hypothetical protein n=1 Tax=Nocardia testacea TaxID=248551 RepID=UPI0002E5768E|nr:hypothetical protein [Nocardia testacea]